MKRTNEEEQIVDPLVKRIRDKVDAQKREEERAIQDAVKCIKDVDVISEKNIDLGIKTVEESFVEKGAMNPDFMSYSIYIPVPPSAEEELCKITKDSSYEIRKLVDEAYTLYRTEIVKVWNQRHPTLVGKLGITRGRMTITISDE